jgi:hypothetical protein
MVGTFGFGMPVFVERNLTQEANRAKPTIFTITLKVNA